MQTPTPEYPTRREYESTRRDFLSAAGRIALGIGLASLVLPVLAEPSDEAPKTGGQAFDPKAFGKQVDELAKLLGNKEFKQRKDATEKLIALAQDKGTDATLAEKRQTIVLEKMTALQKEAADPEVTERARLVVLALQPEPVVKPNDPVELLGEMAE